MQTNSPSSNEDLPTANHLRERDRAIGLPVLNSFGGVDEDDEVVVGSLEVNLDLGVVSTHIG